MRAPQQLTRARLELAIGVRANSARRGTPNVDPIRRASLRTGGSGGAVFPAALIHDKAGTIISYAIQGIQLAKDPELGVLTPFTSSFVHNTCHRRWWLKLHLAISETKGIANMKAQFLT